MRCLLDASALVPLISRLGRIMFGCVLAVFGTFE